MSPRSSAALMLLSLSMACATSPRATQEPATTPATQSAPPAAQTSQVPAAPATLNPVGTFDYTAILPDGTAAPGTFTITGSNGAWTGTITRTGEAGSTELTDIAVDGQMLTARTVIPDGQVTFYVTFDGPQFSGKWTIQGAEGAFNGRRR